MFDLQFYSHSRSHYALITFILVCTHKFTANAPYPYMYTCMYTNIRTYLYTYIRTHADALCGMYQYRNDGRSSNPRKILHLHPLTVTALEVERRKMLEFFAENGDDNAGKGVYSYKNDLNTSKFDPNLDTHQYKSKSRNKMAVDAGAGAGDYDRDRAGDGASTDTGASVSVDAGAGVDADTETSMCMVTCMLMRVYMYVCLKAQDRSAVQTSLYSCIQWMHCVYRAIHSHRQSYIPIYNHAHARTHPHIQAPSSTHYPYH